MMRRLLNLLVFVAIAGIACADEPRARPLERLFQRDANGDGRLTRDEFPGRDRFFNRLDKDGDGAITREELASARSNWANARRRQALPDDVEVVRDVVFGTGGGTELALDIVRPKQLPPQRMPVIVFIHGGGWRSGDKGGGVRRLIPFAQKGYFTASINYRLTGIASFPAQIEDCKCAIRFLRANADRYHLDSARIGVWGSSAGGHLAALLGTSGGIDRLEGSGGWPGTSSRVQAVCDWYGPSDLVAMAKATRPGRVGAASPQGKLLGGAVQDQRERAAKASPVTYVSSDDPPFLIVHGTDDPVVPYSQSVILAEALKAAGVEATLVPLEGAKHGGQEFSSPQVTNAVVAFFEHHLKKPSVTTSAEPPPVDHPK